MGFYLALFISLVTATAFLPFGKTYAIGWTTVVLLAIVAQFFIFLFRMMRSAHQNVPAVGVFVLMNVLSIIVLFANLYWHIGIKDSSDPAATVTFLTALYYSTSTWTTLTYGDIVPVQATRPIAAIQALIGYAVMAFLIAIILSMLQRRR